MSKFIYLWQQEGDKKIQEKIKMCKFIDLKSTSSNDSGVRNIRHPKKVQSKQTKDLRLNKFKNWKFKNISGIKLMFSSNNDDDRHQQHNKKLTQKNLKNLSTFQILEFSC